jgi:electron transfer flavoprotein beta subunit
MKIIVCAKQVPDPEKFPVGRYRDDKRLDRDAFPTTVNPIDKNATELALTYCGDDPVRVLTMGPASAVTAIREILSLGVGSATHVCDPQLAGADLLKTAKVLAAAINKQGAIDLIICGKQTTDSMNSSIPAMIAELLGIPSLLGVESATITDGFLEAKTISDNGLVTWKIQLPAVISVTKNINIPRLPSLRGMTKAMSIPIETLNVIDLGLQLDEDSISITSQDAMSKQIETVIVEGENPAQKANNLVTLLKDKGVML